jgi:hypothetical protein
MVVEVVEGAEVENKEGSGRKNRRKGVKVGVEVEVKTGYR